jgi:glycosyltransferase involved in cell wall biosynthesis
MPEPLVSVIIPSYNCESTIYETIESILGQSWRKLELIIVDDGSTDETRALLSKLRLDSRVKLIFQENMGASAARNRGLAQSQGDFIQFLDADDLISEDKIELQIRAIDSRIDTVASCRWGRFVDSPTNCKFVTEPVWYVKDPVCWLIRSMLGDGMMHSGGWLVPRNIIELAGTWNEELSLHDDGEFFARVLLSSNQNVFVEDAVAYYRTHRRGISAGHSLRSAMSALRAAELKSAALTKVRNNTDALRAIFTEYASVAYQFGFLFPDVAQLALSKMRDSKSFRLISVGGRMFRICSVLLGVENAIKLRMSLARFPNLRRTL